ncbi:MAG: DNA integrity scanning protein DisA nucleotide-binding domain protein [Bacilli bacterium]
MNLVTLIDEVNPIVNFSNPYFVVDFILSLLLVLILSCFASYKLKNPLVIIFYVVTDVLFLISSIFSMEILRLISVFLLMTGTILFLFINAGVIRKYFAIPMKYSGSSIIKKNIPQPVADKEKQIESIVAAVDWLSKNKVGALITFEKSTPMDEFIKSGTVINCPVTAEILETIFYEGTRLHDGAVIIKNGTIIAAAVYYPPSNKAVVGKFGARHRAALGISEVTDSITIVVSEETGRIALAHAGMLDNIKRDEFENVFRNQVIRDK